MRHGGFSPTPWKSLNFGSSVGDDLKRVKQNKEKALASVGIEPQSVYDVYQVHSTVIVVTGRPLATDEPHQKADGIITNNAQTTLLMRFADCVPILLFDPVRNVIGMVHAGWAGTVNKIAEKAIMCMVEQYGSLPADIQAGIGPSIGPDHYVVGKDVFDQVRIMLNGEAEGLIFKRDHKYVFDLWKANQMILHNAGVTQVEIAGICTQCHLNDWYSHRGENGKTGRFGAVMRLT
jgi:YfiH family protein